MLIGSRAKRLGQFEATVRSPLSMTKPLNPFDAAVAAPADPIAGLTEQFMADTRAHKVNLGVGVYLNAQGQLPVLRAVRQAQEQLLQSASASNYLPIDGLKAYNAAVQQLVFGPERAAQWQDRVLTVQAPGGTGALRIGADLLARLTPGAQVWVSQPTWANHIGVFKAAGLPVAHYPYYDAATQSVDEHAFLGALNQAPAGTVVVLHACCHNPSGADLTPAQWQALASLMRERQLIAFLDMAYQGFADGLEEDALAARVLLDAGVPLLVASSFSKNLSLYGERVGALTVVAASAEQKQRLQSEVKQIIRVGYSNPPTYGARLALAVLSDPALFAQWQDELTQMRQRVKDMRGRLVQALRDLGHGTRFDGIEAQRGLFSFLGISAEQAQRLRQEHAIYALDSGRICIAGLREENLAQVAQALTEVVQAEALAVS